MNEEEIKVLRGCLQIFAKDLMKSTFELKIPNHISKDEYEIWSHSEEFELSDLIINDYASLVDKSKNGILCLHVHPKGIRMLQKQWCDSYELCVFLSLSDIWQYTLWDMFLYFSICELFVITFKKVLCHEF